MIGKVVPPILVFGALGGAWLAVHHMGTAPETHDSEVRSAPEEGPMKEVLKLPPGKVNSAELIAHAASQRSIQHSHSVPGRITYDETRHVEVRTPIDGILEQVLVQPGDRVVAGQLLATLSSPEVGSARSELMRCQSHEELRTIEANRAQEVASNVRRLVELLDEEMATSDIEAKLQGLELGEVRKVIQAAHARLQLAKELRDNVQPLIGSGAMPERVIRERQSEYEIARAEFEAAREQALFDVAQAEREASAKLADAKRQTQIAQQTLQSLIGNSPSTDSQNEASMLSTLQICAPMAGTIESRKFASSERVYRADTLYVLADTSSLYVSAAVREKDWPAVGIKEGTEVEVIVPAVESERMSARVQYVGREVDPNTNSIPVVAALNNPTGLLRPGMFVRVVLPIGEPQTSLVVRPESILRHDDQQFVFVQVGDYEFQRVPIETGLETENWTEVKQGLELGQRVVERGAFLLKSEWLLEGESE
ncbi:Cobalt-zinc-cadmium resistance protein CzcB [Bremerella volcania]|uniref:Cobalt-zinc-cadmium resistance protein CzcB n=2 Tax=Bremerella volcania TaxID=2527984 RepID=A0A518C8Z3_9BACT|nr:Cobalt-zinc-cadmium resistance protein CzcB [Bremerella volcania]